jgi:hypothetical protein
VSTTNTPLRNGRGDLTPEALAAGGVDTSAHLTAGMGKKVTRLVSGADSLIPGRYVVRYDETDVLGQPVVSTTFRTDNLTAARKTFRRWRRR